MAVELGYSPEVDDLVKRTTAFIHEVVLPIENANDGDITAAIQLASTKNPAGPETSGVILWS